jgi:HPt (histidine-containing phosphotransfer) domain-containing protein
MINWEDFNTNFQYYENEIVLQIIDMFVQDHQEDMKMIEQNIINKDFTGLKFNAHHLKGSLANFMDPETTELTRRLEEMGENNSEEGLASTFAGLQSAFKTLIQELLEHRKKLTS